MLDDRNMVKPVEIFQGFPIYRKKKDIVKVTDESTMSGGSTKNKQESDLESAIETSKSGGMHSLSLD